MRPANRSTSGARARNERPATLALSVSGDVLLVEGEIDAATTPCLAAALADPAVRAVDLSATHFIDAAGVGALIAAVRQRPLRFVAWSDSVGRLLELTGTDRVILGGSAGGGRAAWPGRPGRGAVGDRAPAET